MPKPALRPSARPCLRLGKNSEMLFMEEEKAPPPTPVSAAQMTSWVKDASLLLRIAAAQMHGMRSATVVHTTVTRPPEMGIMKVLTQRMTPPARPAMAGMV